MLGQNGTSPILAQLRPSRMSAFVLLLGAKRSTRLYRDLGRMNAADSVGSQRNVDVAGATRTSCRPIQGRHIAASACDARDDFDHENAALNAIRPFLDAGESAVSTAVDVQHFAATPVGHKVCATAEVINVEGKRVDFKVSASDGIEEAAEPTNELSSMFVRSTSALPKRGLLTQRPT